MRYYIAQRLFWSVVIVFGIVVVNFVLTRIVPGDPTTALVGEFPVPQAYIDQIRHDFGLDQSIPAQLYYYLVHVAQGDLGFSFVGRQNVLPLILRRAGVTLILMLPSLTLASIIGVLIAVRAARRAGSSLNTFLTALSLAGASVPVFWLAQMLVMLFAVRLGWLPAQGMVSVRANYTGLAYFLDLLRHLILPSFCITIFYLAIVVRVARTSMLEMLHQDFVLTARAKGLSENQVVVRHVLRNALIPVITVIGYNFGYSLTGAILTETVFAWPGIGGLFVSSIHYQDFPVLSGIFLLAATAVVAANFITDILYAVVDPRVRVATLKPA
ncbi:ABC transporter permease [Ancylobacter mangrovi]|uniref:ABC transporter permease n=1 Tax=Ancylobacter mangrovi TaxID=2972472 RepID=A0A9X2T417_9HYPH|nr:ABC transporter permease [Ancylobacter mangrovi]MCS0495531.1 ABC transporter permease [Ancylobacter mangrovi]MCS0503179.1 ABC transporter permease [Ancylobacter mangrovi]